MYPPSACPSPLPHLHALLEKRTPKHRRGFRIWLAMAPITLPFALVRASFTPPLIRTISATPLTHSPSALGEPAIIPNFPFFFCVWRSWSHYRGTLSFPHPAVPANTHANPPRRAAYKASEYLQSLLHKGAIISQSSPELDVIYAKYAPCRVDAPESEKPPPPSDHAPSGSERSEKGATSDAASPLLLTKEAVVELQKALNVPEDSTFAADVYRALEQARLRLEGKRD